MKFILAALMFFQTNYSWAQAPIKFYVNDPTSSSHEVLQLEGFIYEPISANGKLILFSHGSTGGKKESISYTSKYPTIAAEVNKYGYTFVVFMRKGRGKSEGRFTEESGKCEQGDLDKEVDEAFAQLDQVVDQVREKFKNQKIILMGHSRGGFLSSKYASLRQDKVMASINLAGVWSAFCENRNSGYSHQVLKESAKMFRFQYWAYFNNDSYFSERRFNDSNYQWLFETAVNNNLKISIYPDGGELDGHSTAWKKPEIWSQDVFDWLARVER